VPGNWSVQVTTGTPSPSIVISNERRQRIDQLSIGILSQKSLEICEIQVYANSNLKCFAFKVSFTVLLTFKWIAFVFMLYKMLFAMAPAGQQNRTRWIVSSNAQGG
jgi:hypothetical protein